MKEQLMLLFFLRKVLHQASGTFRPRRAKINRLCYRPVFERLEDRLSPATVNWTGQTGDFRWNSVGNWDVGVPGPMDDAVIGPAFSGVTVTSLDDVTINSVSSRAALSVTGRSFTFSNASSIHNTLTISAASLFADGPLDLQNLSLNGGFLAGSGTVTVSGVASWTTGTMQGPGTTTIANTGSLVMSTTNSKTLTRTLNTAGPTTWSAGPINTSSAATISNSNTWDIQGDLNLGGGTPTFSNSGTLKKSAGTGTSTIDVALNNSGTVEVQSGTLSLSRGGTSSGSFTALAPAATIAIPSHTYTWQTGATEAGPGILLVNGGTLSTGDASVQNLTLASGTLVGTGNLTVNGAASWTGGTMQGTGTTTIASTGSLQISGGSFKNLSGPTLSNAGTVTYSAADGTLRAYNGGMISNLAGGVFDFATDSGVSLLGIGAAPAFSNAGTVRKSAGTGSSTIGIPFNGLDGGVLDAQSGTLALDGGGSFSGVTQVTAAAGTAALTAGTFNAQAGASLGTAGALAVTSGGVLTVSAGVTASAQKLSLAGGAIDGAGTLTVPSGGTLTWTAGTMQGTGTTAVAMEGSLQISGGNFKDLSGRTLSNAGTVSSSAADGTLRAYNGAVINNLAAGVFDFVTDSDVRPINTGPAPSFSNAGTVRKSGGAGTSAIGVTLNNTGTLDVQSGTLFLSGTVSQFSGPTLSAGIYSISGNGILRICNANVVTNGATIVLSGPNSQFVDQNNDNALANFATNNGSFSLLGGRSFTTVNNLSNSGSLTVGAGSILNVSTLTQMASGSLAVQLGGTAAGQFGRIITLSATLDGALNVTEVPGYTPAAGDTFRFLTFFESTGDFATQTGFRLGGGLFLRERHTATDLTLEAFQAQLVFQQQPTDTTAGQSITPAVRVAIVDPATGTPIAFDNTDTVTLERSDGGSLGGTMTQTVSGGVATFGNLSINEAGTGFTLTANSTGLVLISSTAFAITPAAADHLLFSQQPTDTPAGQTISQVIVQVVDQFGNVITSDNTDIVTLTLNDNPMTGATLSGTLTVTVVNRVATFSDLSIDVAGDGYSLQASASGLTSANSDPFSITT
jgi:hypothetical protein